MILQNLLYKDLLKHLPNYNIYIYMQEDIKIKGFLILKILLCITVIFIIIEFL